MSWHEQEDREWFLTFSANEVVLANDTDEENIAVISARRAFELLMEYYTPDGLHWLVNKAQGRSA